MSKRVFYFLLVILVLLFVILLLLLSKKSTLDRQNLNQNQPDAEQSQNQNLQSPVSFPVPRTSFSDYTLNTPFPNLPPSVKMSDLKTTFTTGEVLDLSTKIGFNNSIVEDGAAMILVTDQAGDQQSLLSVSKTSGNFLFASESGYPAGVSGGDATTTARSFLVKMGIMDDTLEPFATYKRETSPGVTFVEFHRSWEKLGLPLLNPVGVLNLDETEKLADLHLGYIEITAPEDPDVIESSDGALGKTRPNQFNTVTVGVLDENNLVTTVTSNIKLFAKTQQKTSAQTLKTPEEALEELKSGKASFSLVKPTGDGVVELDTVFPNSQAVSKNAVINEVVLTYLEEVGQKTQNTLYPHYLFRGTATLDSGYEVKFVETVPAVKQINTLGVFAQASLPTVFPGRGSTLQYGTFNWLSAGPNPNSTVACAGLTQIFQFPNGAYIGWYPNSPPRTWYYVPPPGEVVDAARIAEIKKTLRWEAAKACKGSLNDPTICAYNESSVNFQTACYFAGATSPYIYVYTNSPKQMQISLPNSVTYVDPAFSKENLWNFTASPNGELTLANGLEEKNLYYEFDKSIFQSRRNSLKKNSQGYVVDRNNVSEFVNSVSHKLGLNLAEQESLHIELTRQANKFSSKYLKIGLLDRKMLDEVLPVSITPSPRTYHRLLFSVTSGDPKDRLVTPALQKLTREGDTVIELGAVSL